MNVSQSRRTFDYRATNFWAATTRKEKKLHIFKFLQLDIRSRKAELGTFHIKKFLFSNVSPKKTPAFWREGERESHRRPTGYWTAFTIFRSYFFSVHSWIVWAANGRREGEAHSKGKSKRISKIFFFCFLYSFVVVVGLTSKSIPTTTFHCKIDHRATAFNKHIWRLYGSL